MECIAMWRKQIAWQFEKVTTYFGIGHNYQIRQPQMEQFRCIRLPDSCNCQKCGIHMLNCHPYTYALFGIYSYYPVYFQPF